MNQRTQLRLVQRPATTRLIAGLTLSAASLGAVGCASAEDVSALRTETAALRSTAQSQAARAEEILAGLPPQHPARASAEAMLAAARARESLAAAATAQLDAALAETGEGTPLHAISETVGPWLPGPVQAPLLLGAGLVAALARAAQLKRGLASVAQSIEVASQEDETLRMRLKAQANTLRTIQTASARRVIDETVKPSARPAVRLPV